MRRPFFTLDVFTSERLCGNPLAVVLEAADLDTVRMQAIAREFNLSETVFILPPSSERHRARVRIFTPVLEMPFAGHPLIGSACLLALLDGARGDASAFALETGVGDVPCVVSPQTADQARARLRLPRLPIPITVQRDRSALAAAFGLDPGDIGFSNHHPTRFDAGAAYDCIPVRDLEALNRARPVRPAFDQLFAPPAGLTLLYTRAGQVGVDWRSRMFAPGYGVEEDPATGSAAAAFVGVLMAFEHPGDGVHDIVICQGVEMGRPSRLDLQLTIANGALSHSELAGDAIIISEGSLRV